MTALPIVAVAGMPAHTLVCGDVISVNVGGPSPAWVLEMIKTKAGCTVFLGWVRGMVEASEVRP